MADALSTAESKPTSPTTTTARNKQNPRKFYSHFIFRALVAAIFLVIIPMLPSLAPADSYTQSISTQSWELLHMILVGIAVSYGLFSRRYDDSGGDDHSNNNPYNKSENASESYVSRLLQVTSVFDDEVTDHHHHPSSLSSSSGGSFGQDEVGGSNKVQAWNSRYYRNEPPSMVILPTAESDEEMRQKQQQQQQHLLLKSSSNNTVIRDDGKPLLLPIRSLKSRISDEHGGDVVHSNRSAYRRSKSSISAASTSDDGTKKNGNVISRSRVPDVAAGNNYVNGDGSGGDYVGISRDLSRSNSNLSSRNLTDNSASKGSRRRNGVPGEVGGLDEGSRKNKTDVDEEISVVLPSPIPWRSRSGKRELMPALEIDTNNNNNNNNNNNKTPQSSARLSSSSSSGSSTPTGGGSPIKPHPKPTESQTRTTGDNSMRRRRRRKSIDKSSPPRPSLSELSPVRVMPADNNQVSTTRNRKHESNQKKLTRGLIMDEEDEDDEANLNSGRGDYQLEGNELRTRPDSPIAKSVRTMRGVEPSSSSSSSLTAATATTEIRMSGRSENGYVHRNTTNVTDPPFLLDHETNDFLEQVHVATDDSEEEESEIDDGSARDQVQNAKSAEENVSTIPASSSSSSGDHAGEGGPDVDKKADEFIAKFREQIRLQRIESIKRTSGQLSRNS